MFRISEQTLNNTDRNLIIYQLEQIIQPKREEWGLALENDQARVDLQENQTNKVPTSFIGSRTSEKVQFNMVTSRTTQIDGKRKVKHMIEITGTASNSQAEGKKRAQTGGKLKKSRPISHRYNEKPVMSFDDRLNGVVDMEEIGTVAAVSEAVSERDIGSLP